MHVNPAEFALESVNIDFSPNRETAEEELAALHRGWLSSPSHLALARAVEEVASSSAQIDMALAA